MGCRLVGVGSWFSCRKDGYFGVRRLVSLSRDSEKQPRLLAVLG